MGRKERRRAESGFTFIEIVVVLAVIGLMAAWGIPALLQTLNRVKMTSFTRETAIFMQRARSEAIKRGTARVDYQNAATCSLGVPCIVAFAGTTSDIIAGPYPLPNGIQLWAPLDATAEGINAIVGWDDTATPNPGPVYNSDGSVDAPGAFRFRDHQGNYLEVRIEFISTAKPSIRKWFGGGDPDANWHENGEKGFKWTW